MGANLGLSPDWAYNVIKQVGNYGEIFEANLGQETPLKIERGLNAQWKDGGLQYAMPVR
jgi:general L-amino acid transport system substrate-binding protein